MFRWAFGLTIQATNGAFGLEREVDLPFPPQAGMSILDVFCEGCELTIRSFAYDLATREFWIYTEEKDQDWGRDFTPEDAGHFMAHGVLVDDHSDPEAWQADRSRREAEDSRLRRAIRSIAES